MRIWFINISTNIKPLLFKSICVCNSAYLVYIKYTLYTLHIYLKLSHNSTTPVISINILPSRSSFISLAACIQSSFKFFSICLLRAREARSSALMAQPMITAWRGPRATVLVIHYYRRRENDAAGLGTTLGRTKSLNASGAPGRNLRVWSPLLSLFLSLSIALS